MYATFMYVRVKDQFKKFVVFCGKPHSPLRPELCIKRPSTFINNVQFTISIQASFFNNCSCKFQTSGEIISVNQQKTY